MIEWDQTPFPPTVDEIIGLSDKVKEFREALEKLHKDRIDRFMAEFACNPCADIAEIERGRMERLAMRRQAQSRYGVG